MQFNSYILGIQQGVYGDDTQDKLINEVLSRKRIREENSKPIDMGFVWLNKYLKIHQ